MLLVKLGVQRWRQPTIIARSIERRISMLGRMESAEVRLKSVRINDNGMLYESCSTRTKQRY